MKNMFILALVSLAIIGCGSSVNGWVINNATIVCKDHGGIDYIEIIQGNSVVCSDGSIFYLKRKEGTR